MRRAVVRSGLMLLGLAAILLAITHLSTPSVQLLEPAAGAGECPTAAQAKGAITQAKVPGTPGPRATPCASASPSASPTPDPLPSATASPGGSPSLKVSSVPRRTPGALTSPSGRPAAEPVPTSGDQSPSPPIDASVTASPAPTATAAASDAAAWSPSPSSVGPGALAAPDRKPEPGRDELWWLLGVGGALLVGGTAMHVLIHGAGRGAGVAGAHRAT